MTEAVIAALITGVCSVVAVIITNVQANKRVETQMAQQQAVFQVKLDELTREVRQHNNFAQRVPILENEVDHLKQQLNKTNP